MTKKLTAPEFVSMFDDYQRLAMETAVYRNKTQAYTLAAKTYAALGLAGESGEYANKIKKMIRGDFDPESNTDPKTCKSRGDRFNELGDVLWYLALAAEEEGWNLSDIAHANICKLFDRANRNVIKGDGDDR